MDRITAPANQARTVQLKGQSALHWTSGFDQGAVEPGMPIDHATLLFKPAAGLAGFLAAQQTPGTAEYHHWLTPDQFGDRFGLSVADLGKVTAWLESQGLKVEEVPHGRTWVTFSGTAAQAGRAFGTELHRYLVAGKMHFANSGPIFIPNEFEAVVGGVIGLDDFGPQSQIVSHGAVPQYTSGKYNYLAPGDLATIYNLSPLYAAGIDGTGQTIAIVGESALNLKDLRSFRQRFSLPGADPQVVLVGKDPGTNDSQVESNLDLEWAGAVARNANLIYVYAANVYTAAETVVDQNLAPVLSMSWGSCEVFTSTGFRAVAQQANAQGITWLAASGDGGAATCDYIFSPTPEASLGATELFPATLPEITAVGGTQFTDYAASYWGASGANGGTAISYIPESVWNDLYVDYSPVATGGGPSALFSKPYWQSGPSIPNDSARDIPDVSFAASEAHDGYLIYYQGVLSVVGGTSAATPVFAGMVALLNQSVAANQAAGQPGLGNINPSIYRLAQATTDVFHDITDGDNKVWCALESPGCVDGYVGYSSRTGYDLTTGWGSLDANRFVAEWNSGQTSTTTVTASSSTAAIGDSVQLTAIVTGSGPTPTGTVAFLVMDGTDGLIATGNLSGNGNSAQASVTVNAASILGGDGTVRALYNGDAVYTGSSGKVSVALRPQAAGSYVVPFVTPNPVPATGVGPNWQFQVVLSEKAGVATTLTSYTLNGSTRPGTAFGGGSIPANGTVAVSFVVSGIAPPETWPVSFTGKDADGTVWTRSATIQFLAPTAVVPQPGLSLGSVLATVQQNPSAPASCQWSVPVVVQETGGFYVELTSFLVGSQDVSSSIQQLFGTTRIAPFGMLQASVCFPANSSGGVQSFTIGGNSELPTSNVGGAFLVTLAPAPATPVQFTATPSKPSVLPGTQTVALDFGGKSPAWTATVFPATANAWVKLSSASGTGAATLSIQTSVGGLSPGVYTAFVAIQAANSSPQAINIPVTLVVGLSSKTVINGVANAASYGSAAAPGMYLYVAGQNFYPDPNGIFAWTVPLPLTMYGLTARVNGITAPIYYALPQQMVIQIPYEVGAGPAVLEVNSFGEVAYYQFQISPVAPGIFTAPDLSVAPNPSGKPGDALLAFITGDGDLSPSLPTGASPPASTAVASLPKSRLPLTLTVGGVPATIQFYGVPPGLAGVSQINFVVPQVAAGLQDVVVTVGGVASAAAKLTVLAP